MKQTYYFSVDSRLRINSWEEQIARFTGRNASAVIGKKYYKVFPRIFSGDKDALSLVLEKGKRVTLKGYNINCLLASIRTDIRVDPVRTAKGVTGVKITISDILTCTALKSHQGSERLIEIGKIASSLAHGVRNPLNAIKGSVVYLSEKFADEPALIEFAKIMEEEISRLDNFISRFLSTSFSDTELSVTDINSLLKKIEAFTSLQTRACSIKTIYKYGDIPSVMLNSFHIEQAILNVINNSIEAMPSGGQLTVKTRFENLKGLDFVMIEISDTGPGMAESKINHMSINLEDKGRGFGLFITREIIQSCRGYIQIKSKKGKGTTVKLYLPVNAGNRVRE